MNWLSKLFGKGGVKSADWTAVPVSGGYGPYLTINLKGSLSQAMKSPTYASAISWIQRNITEPDLVIETKTTEGWEVVENSKEQELVLSPMKGEDGRTLQTSTDRLQGLAFDLPTFGNGYLYKLRGASGAVVGVQWLPASAVVPMVSRGSIITSYSVTVGGGTKPISPEDMIHIRLGHDPDNLHLGRPVVASIGDALNQDAAGAAYMRRMLNGGGLGVVGSPKGDASDVDWGKQAEAVRAAMKDEAKAGFTFVGGPIDLQRMGYSPEQMALGVMLTHAQQTICAAIGVPAQVLGVMAAEKTSTFANVQEANRQAAQNCLGPLWDIIAEALTYNLLGDGLRARFQWESIQALQENEDALWARVTEGYAKGVLTRAEAQRALGYEPDADSEDHYASFDRMAAPTGLSLPSKSRPKA